MKDAQQKYHKYNISDSIEAFKEKMMTLRSLLTPPYMNIAGEFIHPNKITRQEAKKHFNKALRQYRGERLINLISHEKPIPIYRYFGQMLSLMDILKVDELSIKDIEYVIENANYLAPEHFLNSKTLETNQPNLEY